MSKVSKDLPLAEVTLRKYPKPFNLEGRELVKKFCLSLGLLQSGDSRDVIVDVFYSMIQQKEISIKEVERSVVELRKKHELPMIGIASSNIRRQVRRLKELSLIEKSGNNYRITEHAPLHELFEEKILPNHIKSITDRVKEYCAAVEKLRMESLIENVGSGR